MRSQEIAKKTTKTGIAVCCVVLAAFLVGFIFQEQPSQQSATELESELITHSSSPNSSTTSNIDQESWELMLVSAAHPMPENYQPSLDKVDNNGHLFDKRAANSLRRMLSDAEEAGLNPIICSSYRSVEKQTGLYNEEVQKQAAKGMTQTEARAAAATVVAYPGTSEHNLGLAADIVALDYQLLDENQAQTPEAVWLRKNCSKYGFILRYPENKSDQTGVIFEPWHYRYVGAQAAAEIMEQGICLEEYLKKS